MSETRFVPWEMVGAEKVHTNDATTAVIDAGLDYDVHVHNLNYEQVDGSISQLKDKVAVTVIRDGKEEFIAETRRDAVQIPNKEAFSLVNGFVKEYGAKIERIADEPGCRSTWMVASLPTTKILDDDVNPFLIMRNFHDGTSNPLRIISSPIRVACYNQINALENNKSAQVFKTSQVPKDEKENTDAVRALFQIHQKRMQHLSEEAERFAVTKVSQADFYKFAEELYPTSTDVWDLSESKRQKNQYYKDNLIKAYLADDLGNFRESIYGVLNAVSDFATHTIPYGKDAFTNDMYLKQMVNTSYVIGLLAYCRSLLMTRYGIKFGK